jgi:hypothetical protein
VTWIKTAAKAFLGALTALIGGLLLVITGNEGFADVTTSEWLLVFLQVVGVFSAVYFPKNKTV